MSLLDRWTGRVVGFFDDVLLPDEQRVQLVRARRALEEGRAAEALVFLEQIEARRPGHAKVLELIGLARLALGDGAGASKALREAALQRPEGEVLWALAQALEASGEVRGARDALREAQRVGVEGELALRVAASLGRVYLRLGRADRAAHEVRRALRGAAGPGVGAAQEVLGRALLARGEAQEAASSLRAARESGEGSGEVDARYGEALLRCGDAPRAWAVLGAASTARPEDGATRVLAAQAAWAAGDVAGVEGLLASWAARLEGASGLEARVLLGRAALRRGAWSAALGWVEPALVEARGLVGAVAVVAEARLMQAAAGDRVALEAAEAMFERLREVGGESAEAWAGLGRCRLLAGAWAGARRALEQARELGSADGVEVELGRCALEAGDVSAAVALLSGWVQREAGAGEALSAWARAAEASGEAARLLAEARGRLRPPLEVAPEASGDPRAVSRAVQAAVAWAAQTPGTGEVLAGLRVAQEALEQPLSVAVMGEFNAGKSSLVNALLGEAIVPMGVLPTTAHINVMRYGTRRVAELHGADGAVEEVAFSEVRRRVKEDEGAGQIDHLEYLYPHPDLRRVHLWDTPGFNALNADHEAQARRALERAEAILWVCDAAQALTRSELDVLAELRAPEERVLVVLNKVDRLGEDDDARAAAVAEVVAHLEEGLAGRALGIFPVSALLALQGMGEGSGLPQLRAALEASVFDRAGRLKALEASARLEGAAETLRGISAARLALLQGLRETLAGVEARIQAEEARFIAERIPQEQRMLADQLDFLLTVIEREIHEALRPSPGLMGALLTRVELAEEDAEFVTELLVQRFKQILARSQGRLDAALLEWERQLGDLAVGLAARLEPREQEGWQRRIQGWSAASRAQRMLLTERVYGRYGLLALGRASAPSLGGVLQGGASRGDAAEADRRAALRSLLPPVESELGDELARWAREYFGAALHFCAIVRRDLHRMEIEAEALCLERIEGSCATRS